MSKEHLTINRQIGKQGESLSWAVSRILSGAVIYLGRELPLASSSLPGSCPLAGKGAGHSPARRPSFLLGLAPGGGYLAAPVTRNAGGLLHHLFTLAWSGDPRRFFSVALSPSHLGRALPGAAPYGVRTFLTPAVQRTPKRDYPPNSSSIPRVLRFDVPSTRLKRPQDDFRRRQKSRAGRSQSFHP